MIKKGKKAVLLTTMLSVLSTNTPSIAVYANDDLGNVEPPALDVGGDSLTFDSDTETLVTDSGMVDWLDPDVSEDLSVPIDLAASEDSDEDDVSSIEDKEDDGSFFPENQEENNTSIDDSKEENSSLFQEASSEYSNLDAEVPNGTNILNTEQPNVKNNLYSSNVNSEGNLASEDSTSNDNIISDILAEDDSLYSESPSNEDALNQSRSVISTDTLIEEGDGFSFDKESGILTITDESAFELIEYYDLPKWMVDISVDPASISQVIIDNSVTTIGQKAFYDCLNLEKITFPDTLKSIGASAFENCRGLTNIIIPASVSNIGKNAFFCPNLESVTFLGLIAPINTILSGNGSNLNMESPFGVNADFLPVYVPYGSTGYDTQIGGWYTLWYLPKLQPKIADETAYFQISLFNAYKEFKYYKEWNDSLGQTFSTPMETLPNRNVSYSYTLEKWDSGEWIEIVTDVLLSKATTRTVDKLLDGGVPSYSFGTEVVDPEVTKLNPTEYAYTLDPTRLLCNIGSASLAEGEYRCLIYATCYDEKYEDVQGLQGLGYQVYTLISDVFSWKKSDAEILNPDSSESGEGSDSSQGGSESGPSQSGGGGDFSQKDDESNPSQKDDEPDSSGKDDESGSSQNGSNSDDSSQSSGNSIGSYSVGSSLTQSNGNNFSNLWKDSSNTAPTDISQDNGNSLKAALDGSQSNSDDGILAEPKADEISDSASDKIGWTIGSINFLKQPLNVVLSSFIAFLFIVRVLMLFIGRKKSKAT